MAEDVKDTIVDIMEAVLVAQLRAIRKFRPETKVPNKSKSKKGRSHVDMTFDVLKKAGAPLHITMIIKRIDSTFGVSVDRESLVSALTKKVARSDRFQRTDKNTFALLERSAR